MVTTGNYCNGIFEQVNPNRLPFKAQTYPIPTTYSRKGGDEDAFLTAYPEHEKGYQALLNAIRGL